MVALALVIVGVSHFATGYLNFGRRFYAIGSNPDAAELAGLPPRRIVFTAFLLSGALAGLAGFMTLARFGNITVENGIGLELQVVAAVVVGGVNIGDRDRRDARSRDDRHAGAEPVPPSDQPVLA
jgi:rhamnose transport system permease protein